jgi:hypothetical protein
MSRNRVRWVLRLAALAVAGLAGLLWAMHDRENHLTIENRSGQAIMELRLTVGEQSSTFRGIPTGSDVTTPFTVQPDAPFSMEGQLFDKSLIRGKGVAGTDTRLTILPDRSFTIRQGGR